MASHRTDTQLWLTRVPRAVVAQISRRLRSDSPLTELDRAVYANAILAWLSPVAPTRSW